MADSWEGGSTYAWRKLRAKILNRDRHRCQMRLAPDCDCDSKRCTAFHGCTTIADCVHHLDGKAQGDNPDRLVASCTPCNLHIGNPAGKDPDPRPRTQW